MTNITISWNGFEGSGGITVASAIYYTTENQRSAGYSKGKQVALTLAEAGLNNANAVLNEPNNNSLHQIVPKCTGNAQPSWNRTNLDGGYTLWCGDLDLQNSWWDLTSIGFVRSPNNASTIQHTIKERVVVTPVITQPLNNPAWNYMFASHTGSACDETLNNNVTGGSRMYVAGNLCLNNNVALTPSSLWVKGNLDLSNNAAVGAAHLTRMRAPSPRRRRVTTSSQSTRLNVATTRKPRANIPA